MSIKRLLLAVAAIFVTWQIIDFIDHVVILSPVYAETEELWRPMAEMRMGLVRLVSLLGTTIFVFIYARLIAAKGLGTALRFGILWGLAHGTSMAYGTYAVMPIPYHMALVWFLGAVVQGAVAGLLAGWLVRAPAVEPAAA
ncbi:MAG: hypothetical protein ABIL09_04780 [Gemmatimonadota bacterium]